VHFVVQPVNSSVPAQPFDVVYLVTDDWNDYWTYRRQYHVTYVTPSGERVFIGNVKIGQVNWDRNPVDGSERPQEGFAPPSHPRSI
jgi:hypothetical protein